MTMQKQTQNAATPDLWSKFKQLRPWQQLAIVIGGFCFALGGAMADDSNSTSSRNTRRLSSAPIGHLQAPSRGASAPTMSPAEVNEMGGKLGLGFQARENLGKIASSYGQTVQAVADQAVSAAASCVGGMEQVGAHPARAVRKIEGSLEFVSLVKVPTNMRKSTSMNELFVTYVLMGCPEPS